MLKDRSFPRNYAVPQGPPTYTPNYRFCSDMRLFFFHSNRLQILPKALFSSLLVLSIPSMLQDVVLEDRSFPSNNDVPQGPQHGATGTPNRYVFAIAFVDRAFHIDFEWGSVWRSVWRFVWRSVCGASIGGREKGMCGGLWKGPNWEIDVRNHSGGAFCGAVSQNPLFPISYPSYHALPINGESTCF